MSSSGYPKVERNLSALSKHRVAKYIHGTSLEEQERLAVLNQLLNQRCMLRIQLSGNERILDVGCGLGILTRMLASRLTSGHVVGVEKESAQIDRGELLADAELVNVTDIRQGSAYDLPLQPHEWNTFDLCFIRFLLEHLSDPRLAVQQVFDALRQGGKLILVDDDHANFRITPRQPAFERLWKAYIDVYRNLGNDPFMGRNLISLLHDAGFNELKIDFILFGATADEEDFMHYANNLIGILLGSAEDIQAIYSSPEDFAEDIQAIYAWSKLPDATLWYAANWAEGVK